MKRPSHRHLSEAFPVRDFEPQFEVALPETYALIASANFVVHPRVSRIVLHGSRGLAGGYRPDSDVDLSLIVDPPQSDTIDLDLKPIVETTLQHWQAPVEADLAVIFDLRNCELNCFDQTAWNDSLCWRGGVDCFGLYKIQKGFHGLVSGAGIRVQWMYPCLKIWPPKSPGLARM